MSAMPAPRCSTGCSPARLGGQFLLRIDDTDQRRARPRNSKRRSIAIWPGWACATIGSARQINRLALYAARRRPAEGGGPPLSLLTRPRPSWSASASCAVARASRRIYDRAALDLPADEREAGSRRPQAPLALQARRARTVAWTDLVRGPVEIDTATMSDPVLIARGRRLSLHPAVGGRRYRLRHQPCDPRRGSCHQHRGPDRDLRGAGRAVPAFAHFPLLVGAERRGAVQAAGLAVAAAAARGRHRAAGASASYLAKIGTSDPVEPRPRLDELARGIRFRQDRPRAGAFRCRQNSTGAERQAAAHLTPYERGRAPRCPRARGEAFWEAVKPNLDAARRRRDVAAAGATGR